MGIDEVGIDKVGTDKGGINHCEYAMLLFCSVCSHIFAMILPLFSTECQGPSVITKWMKTIFAPHLNWCLV